jgi:hypothetical protein
MENFIASIASVGVPRILYGKFTPLSGQGPARIP